MRRLIVNADDFGLTAGVNRAIVEAHRHGIVTSTTLMASGRAFDEAVALARSEPTLSVGCHVVLVGGEPILPRDHVPGLVQADGRFRPSIAGFARATLGGRISTEEVMRETIAQIRKIQDAGITVSHLDSHRHAHMFPRVLEGVLRAARECGVRAVRNPYAPGRPFPVRELARRPHLWKRYTQAQWLRRLGGDFRARVAAEELLTTDGTFGIVVTGALDLELFRAVLDCVPEGTWEFVCHPGYDDADLAATGTRLRASRERELNVLTSPEARVLLQERDIELISYQDLITETENRALAPTRGRIV